MSSEKTTLQKEATFSFLLRAAIPEVTDKKYIPQNEKFAKYFTDSSNESKKPKRTSNLIWDAIWRAHRDVLTGFRFKDSEFYAGVKDDFDKEINSIALSLFGLIVDKKNQPLKSQDLIDILYDIFPEPKIPEEKESIESGKKDAMHNATRFEATQKLVNMTLKYLLILKTYGRLPEKSGVEIRIEDCDCPIDSIIIESLSKSKENKQFSNYKWTSLTKSQYAEIQRSIEEEPDMSERIMYDFKNWQ